MNKFICVHGHFYQPPRENPWLESVERQESAEPYHDWNERITAESYAPNAYARLLDGDQRIENIVNNYSRISFNFGPTLLSWMKEKAPDIYQAIQQADVESQKRFSGHGSAMAQCYNHMILPLANTRDKYTQVQWGIRDFESRFNRKPEGMWLAETAADNETLEVLANLGIKFTVLSPFQASRVRSLNEGAPWSDVNGGRVNPLEPYIVKFASGKSLAVFFYHADIAKAVAFEELLRDGNRFYDRLAGAADGGRAEDQLINVATDGESYGHHFRYGDMALAYAIHKIEHSPDVKLSVYGEYLENHPPKFEAEIHQGSAWSCSHGVGRWMRDCGCNSGGHGNWNQQWRTPLREALDHLREKLAALFERKGKELLKDPWVARDEYISVILDRSPENRAAFFQQHAVRELNETEIVHALWLLESQRHAMLMYTSCGWFFDEISGIETVQVIQYAARAIQLAQDLSQEDFESEFLKILEQAKSNIPEHRDGRFIYEKFAKPAVMTKQMVAAHFAISSLFESYPDEARIYSFTIHQKNRQFFSSGHARLAIGSIKITYDITQSSDTFDYAVVHMGEHHLDCAIKHEGDQAAYDAALKECKEAFEKADFPGLLRVIDHHFGNDHYSLKNLFRDEQHKILKQILKSTREEIDDTYRRIAEHYAPLARFLATLNAPPLPGLQEAEKMTFNNELQRQFDSERLDVERVRSLLAEASASLATLDKDVLSYAFKSYMDRLITKFQASPENLERLQELLEAANLLKILPFEVNLWRPQNIYKTIADTVLPEMQKRPENIREPKKSWVDPFQALGKELGFRPAQ